MHNLVELSVICPDVLLDILYATENNFVKKVVYPFSACYLQKKAAQRLRRVQRALKKRSLGLKVYDGYRPLSVQKILWEAVPDPRYVADPAEGSKHNRGSAVDLTLVDREGKELLMPSLFDDLSDRAHRDYRGASREARENSQMLEEAMVKEGFIPLPTEWWHFDDLEWEKYPILDIPFEELR